MSSKKSKNYSAVHGWLRYYYGAANCCENKNCDKVNSSYELALIKGFSHEKQRSNYWQLCKRCHYFYDLKSDTIEKMRASKKGVKRTKDSIIAQKNTVKSTDIMKKKLDRKIANEIRKKYIPRQYSAQKLANEYGCSLTNIYNILNYRIYKICIQ